MTDAVNHPSHYTQYSREVIELTELCDFCTGNAIKYILRSPYKGKPVEDLDKAKWYLKRLQENGRAWIDLKSIYVAQDFGSLIVSNILQSILENPVRPNFEEVFTWIENAKAFYRDGELK